MPGQSLMSRKRPLLMRQNGSHVPVRERTPKRPRDDVEKTESPIQNDRVHTGHESDGPPLGGPPGLPQQFDIASNLGAPNEDDSDTSSNDSQEVPSCTPGLAKIVNDAICQRRGHLEAKNVVVAHLPPPPRPGMQPEEVQYSHPIVLMLIRGPYWNRSSQIAFTQIELKAMIVPQFEAILERFGIRKIPKRKDLIIDRILDELFREHDPWLIRGQRYWRSPEPLF